MYNDFGLYIHIPFCKQKCLYCDFPSFAGKERFQREYAEALEKEIGAWGKKAEGRTVTSVFFGGGTPTTMPLALLEKLLNRVFSSFRVAENAEITTEANPGTLNREMAYALKHMGFNRLSMGVQAWQNHMLKSLGRIHTIEEFLENYRIVREAGFDNVNVDLMFALPDQTMENWKETLENITALEPEHISAYSLILEEGTPFYDKYEKGELTLMDEELDREMYAYTKRFLKEKGYEQYEISNFAKRGRQSRHNRIYWEREEYLGMGLGSHSLFKETRFHNTYELEKYISAQGDLSLLTEDVETMTKRDAFEEFMFMGLRLTEGVSFERFEKAFGVPMKEVYGKQIEKLKAEGLLSEENGGIRLTERGTDVSNVVFEEFIF